MEKRPLLLAVIIVALAALFPACGARTGRAAPAAPKESSAAAGPFPSSSRRAAHS